MPIELVRVYDKGALFASEVKRKLNEVITAVNSGSGGGGGGSAEWGGITGILNTQTDLQAALNAKQNTLGTGTATLNFGAFSYSAKVSISDDTVSGTTKVVYGITVSGRDADELEMSPISLAHIVNAGIGIDFYGNALQGADGQFIINYTKA